MLWLKMFPSREQQFVVIGERKKNIKLYSSSEPRQLKESGSRINPMEKTFL